MSTSISVFPTKLKQTAKEDEYYNVIEREVDIHLWFHTKEANNRNMYIIKKDKAGFILHFSNWEQISQLFLTLRLF